MSNDKWCLQEYFADNDEIAYRYLTFPKFKDLICTNKLYLARGDQFNDPYEGMETLYGKYLRRAVHDDYKFDEISELYRRNRRCIAISSWIVAEQESKQMWKEFAAGSDSVAIRTTVGNIRHVLSRWERCICVRKIEYVEKHDAEFTKFGCPFFPFSIKKEKYSHENELRIIYGEGKGCLEGSPLYKAPEISDQGVKLPVNLSVLIGEIVLSPMATPSDSAKVRNFINRAGLDIPVVHSVLNH